MLAKKARLSGEFQISFQAKVTNHRRVGKFSEKDQSFSLSSKNPLHENCSTAFRDKWNSRNIFLLFCLDFIYNSFIQLQHFSLLPTSRKKSEAHRTDESVTDFFLRSCFLSMQLSLPRARLKYFSFVMLNTPHPWSLRSVLFSGIVSWIMNNRHLCGVSPELSVRFNGPAKDCRLNR